MNYLNNDLIGFLGIYLNCSSIPVVFSEGRETDSEAVLKPRSDFADTQARSNAAIPAKIWNGLQAF